MSTVLKNTHTHTQKDVRREKGSALLFMWKFYNHIVRTPLNPSDCRQAGDCGGSKEKKNGNNLEMIRNGQKFPLC